MPRPGYIACASSGSIDGQSNRVSMFDFLETVLVQSKAFFAAPPGTSLSGGGSPDTSLPLEVVQALVEANTVRVMSVWVREDSDSPEVVYESQLACVTPGGEDLFVTPVVTFSFSKQFHRLAANGVPLGFDYQTSGVHFFESRIRRQGATEWQYRQSYPFLVQKPEPTQGAADPDKPKDEVRRHIDL